MYEIVHFKDVQGRPLYVGDVIYRVEYNKMRFGVVGLISPGGLLQTVTFADVDEEDKNAYANKAYRGHMLTFDSKKIIKINKDALSDHQKKHYEEALKLI